jgi:hypothetical protein
MTTEEEGLGKGKEGGGGRPREGEAESYTRYVISTEYNSPKPLIKVLETVRLILQSRKVARTRKD